ncbi:MAG: hypothetical protein ABH843_03510, partial [Candidatus Omnitrophota bacterium]
SIIFITVFVKQKRVAHIPNVKITQGPDNNIDVLVTRAQIKNEIAPVVIEEFLLRTRLASSEEGLRLVEFEDSSLLARYGFREGDIVREVDGHKIDTVKGAIELCESLESELLGAKDAKQIKIALKRDDKEMNMNFTVPEFIPEKVAYTLRLEKRGR